MTGADDCREDGRVGVPADELDPGLQEAFDRAFVASVPVDVGARHLWQLYRNARPRVVDGLAAAPRPGQLRRLAATAMLVLVALIGPGLVTHMASTTLPGHPLYGVKLANERAQVARAFTWEERDAALFGQAQLRLIEAEQLARAQPRRAGQAIAVMGHVIGQLEQSPVASTRDRAEVVRGSAAERLSGVAEQVDDGTREVLMAAIAAVATPSAASPPHVPRTRMLAEAPMRPETGEQISAKPTGGEPSAAALDPTAPDPSSALEGDPGDLGGPTDPATLAAAAADTPAAGTSIATPPASADPAATPGGATPEPSDSDAPATATGAAGCEPTAAATATPAELASATPEVSDLPTPAASSTEPCVDDGAEPDTSAGGGPTDGAPQTPALDDPTPTPTTAAPTSPADGAHATATPTPTSSATASEAPVPATPSATAPSGRGGGATATGPAVATDASGAPASRAATSFPDGSPGAADSADVAPGYSAPAQLPAPSASGTAIGGGRPGQRGALGETTNDNDGAAADSDGAAKDTNS